MAAARTQLARLSRFDDAPSQSYFDSYWTKAEIIDLLEQFAGQSDLYKRYEQLQIEYIKKLAGYRDVNIWDLSVASKDIQTPRFTINQASQIIRSALAPLGSEYGRELAKLLDPANGRIDIVPGKNREHGGFSKGFIGTDSVFFSGGFNGFL